MGRVGGLGRADKSAATKAQSPPSRTPGRGTGGVRPASWKPKSPLLNRLAREEKLPAYCIFAVKTLIALAKSRPATLQQMRQVNGIGAAKLAKHGEAFLEVLREE